jgi:predicted MFS family arabinose efflux permease
MVSNVHAVLEQSLLRSVLLTVLISGVLCAPIVVFCPVLVQQALHGDVSHFSAAVGAFGVGGLLGAVALLGLDAQRDRRAICSVFAIVYGVVVMFASQSTSPLGLALLFACAGFAMTMSNTSANTLLQSAARSELRGQSVSLFMLVMRGGMAFGGLLTGLTVSQFGVQHALLFNGALAVGLQCAVWLKWSRTQGH